MINVPFSITTYESKGAPLTKEQMDANFDSLVSAVNALLLAVPRQANVNTSAPNQLRKVDINTELKDHIRVLAIFDNKGAAVSFQDADDKINLTDTSLIAGVPVKVIYTVNIRFS